MTIPEQAVQAAIGVLVEAKKKSGWPLMEPNSDTVAEMLTAAAPHLAAVRVNVDEIVQPLEELRVVRGLCYWTDIATAIGEIRRSLRSLGPSVCKTCKGRGIIGGMYRVGDGDVDGWEEPCPDCSPSAGRAAVLEEAAQVAERHEGEPCRPAIAWTDEQRQFYASGQQDASSSIAAAIRALHPVADKPDEAGAQGEGWLPIESAPIGNGSNRFLAYITGHGPCVCYRNANRTVLSVDGRTILRATHWRPLPTPPSSEVA